MAVWSHGGRAKEKQEERKRDLEKEGEGTRWGALAISFIFRVGFCWRSKITKRQRQRLLDDSG